MKEFDSFIGVDPVDLPQEYRDALTHLTIKMCEALSEICEVHETQLSFSALQHTFVTMLAQFIKKEPQNLRKLAALASYGIMSNMEVLIKNLDTEDDN
jgi:hypothetical protein